jgi:hypothetical protein
LGEANRVPALLELSSILLFGDISRGVLLQMANGVTECPPLRWRARFALVLIIPVLLGYQADLMRFRRSEDAVDAAQHVAGRMQTGAVAFEQFWRTGGCLYWIRQEGRNGGECYPYPQHDLLPLSPAAFHVLLRLYQVQLRITNLEELASIPLCHVR